VDSQHNTTQYWRFGVFEVDARKLELRRNGTVVRLRDQPFRILVCLLEQPGEIVSRDDLRQKLWPDGTFVDFDQGLNAAVKKLRDALGDVADEPIYIETIPKRGYRFVAPVTKSAEVEVAPTDALGEADARTSRTSDTSALNSQVGPESTPNQKRELASNTSGREASPSRTRTTLLTGALALVTLLLAVLAFVHFREQVPTRQTVRFSILLPDKSRPLSLAVSPDGRAIAMVLVKDGRQQVWVRALDALEPSALAGTDGAADPFWSPDSRFIAFFADAKLKKIDRGGGPVQILCDALAVRGGTWNKNGEILMGGLARVQKVSSAGGVASDLPGRPAVRELYPAFLPDGRHYMATRDGYAGTAEAGVWLSSIDSPETRQVLPDSSNVAIVAPLSGRPIGQVIFTRAGTLMALPFDMERLQAAGDAAPVAQRIVEGAIPYWLAATSQQGDLAYVSGQRGSSQYVWRDGQGRVLGAMPDAGGVVMISPDGKQLVGDVGTDIWLRDFARGTATRLTFGPESNANPIWSPDGRYVAYDKVGVGIFRKPANGAGGEELLVPAKMLAVPKSWSPDGRFILFAQINPGTGADLLGISVEPNAKPFVVAQTPGTEDQGQFSPDGHWIAYTSNESGLSEIYVVPFPPSSSGGKWLVSRGGGVQPRWRRNGNELFYISPDSKMMAVEVSTQPVFQAGTPQPLFQTDIVDTGIRTGPISWDLAPDGNRFLIISDTPGDVSSLTVALNWKAR